MIMVRVLLLLLVFVSFSFSEKPSLLLLKSYNSDINVTNWLISEKLDGVRAYWDGKKLISRNGKEFTAPTWFTKGFPSFEIDGELWTKRGDFENIISIVNTQTPHDGWKKISYQIFEVPHQKGGLLERLSVLEKWLGKNPNEFIKILPQKVCKGSEYLEKLLDELMARGAEGLVVREPNALYVAKRSAKALKVKKAEDDECVVKGYTKGQGKFEGLVGALLCEWKDRVLKIGSGLSDDDRKNPPVIDANITFKYNGLTKYGNPKFPVFLRVRNLP